jgi:hypothetical protein
VFLQALQQRPREIIFLGHGPALIESAVNKTTKTAPAGQLLFPPSVDDLLHLGDVRLPLALANADNGAVREENAPRADEIVSLDLSGTKILWLWACEALGGPIIAGEGVLGYPRAAHIAGCDTIVCSIRIAYEDPTRRFSSSVHQRVWAQGLSPWQAVREQQIHVIEKEGGINAHPDNWAPWIVIGGHDEPSAENTTVPASMTTNEKVDEQDDRKKTSASTWIISGSTALVSLLLLLAFVKRRRFRRRKRSL